MNIIELVKYYIETDDSNTSDYSRVVINLYKASSEKEKDLIDRLFTYLCGFSLDTLIKESSTLDTLIKETK